MGGAIIGAAVDPRSKSKYPVWDFPVVSSYCVRDGVSYRWYTGLGGRSPLLPTCEANRVASASWSQRVSPFAHGLPFRLSMAISFLGGPFLVLGCPRGRERRGTLFVALSLLFFLLPNFLLLLDGCSSSVAPHPLEVDERLNVAVAVRVVQNTGFFFNPSCFCYSPII